MGLPVIGLPTDTVVVADEKIEVRGLSRSEASKLAVMADDMEAAEVFVLACGTGTSEEEVRAWRDATPAAAVTPVVDRIVELSGLGEGAQKSDRAGPDGRRD